MYDNFKFLSTDIPSSNNKVFKKYVSSEKWGLIIILFCGFESNGFNHKELIANMKFKRKSLSPTLINQKICNAHSLRGENQFLEISHLQLYSTEL